MVGLFSPGDNASVLLSNFFFFHNHLFSPPFLFSFTAAVPKIFAHSGFQTDEKYL